MCRDWGPSRPVGGDGAADNVVTRDDNFLGSKLKTPHRYRIGPQRQLTVLLCSGIPMQSSVIRSAGNCIAAGTHNSAHLARGTMGSSGPPGVPQGYWTAAPQTPLKGVTTGSQRLAPASLVPIPEPASTQAASVHPKPIAVQLHMLQSTDAKAPIAMRRPSGRVHPSAALSVSRGPESPARVLLPQLTSAKMTSERTSKKSLFCIVDANRSIVAQHSMRQRRF